MNFLQNTENIFFVFLLSLLMAVNQFEASQTLFVAIVANYSLFPLLFKPDLLIIKLSLYLLYTAAVVYGVYVLQSSKNQRFILPWYELTYAVGLVGLFFYEISLQYLLNLDTKLPFLPLLLTSVYCSIGITYFWLKYYIKFVMATSNLENVTQNTNAKKKRKKI